MKVLSSVILTLVFFVTLSSIHTADGLQCYKCNGENAITGVPGQKKCPSPLTDDVLFECEIPSDAMRPDEKKPICQTVFRNNTKTNYKLAFQYHFCGEMDKKTKLLRKDKCKETGHPGDNAVNPLRYCDCEADKCNNSDDPSIITGGGGKVDDRREGNGSKSIKSGLFSLWPAAFIPLVIRSFGVGQPSS